MLKLAYRALIVIGLLCAAYASVMVIESAWAQNRASRLFAEAQAAAAVRARADLDPDRVAERERPRSRARTVAAPTRAPKEGEPVGRLGIPRIDFSAMVLEGDNSRTLRRGVGHLSRTPMPGAGGNVCLAGHRDTFFRGLKDVRVGDVIRLATLAGSYSYRVDSVLVVDPTDVWVLEPSDDEKLTLLSCYPFYYVGHAPKRFVVQASLHSALIRDGGAQ